MDKMNKINPTKTGGELSYSRRVNMDNMNKKNHTKNWG